GLSSIGFAMLVWASIVTFLVIRNLQVHLQFRRRVIEALKSASLSTNSSIGAQVGSVERDPDTLTSALPVSVSELAGRIGVNRKVRVLLSDELPSPAVWGLFDPTIILPTQVAAQFSSKQLQWVLLHELAHIRRWDLLVVAFQRFATVLHFLNPALWIANRMIH